MYIHRSTMALYCSDHVIDRQIMVPHNSIIYHHKTNIVFGDSINKSHINDSCNSIARLISFNESLDAALQIELWSSSLRYMEINSVVVLLFGIVKNWNSRSEPCQNLAAIECVLSKLTQRTVFTILWQYICHTKHAKLLISKMSWMSCNRYMSIVAPEAMF